MAFGASELTSAVALIAAVGAIVVPIWSSRQNVKPATDEALTKRFTELVDRQGVEREKLEKHIIKMETVAADLEVMVLKLTAWRDDVIVLMRMRGILDFPEPPKFH